LSQSAKREAILHPEFLDDLRYWVKTDRNTALRIFDLVESILRDPLQGIGKPEPLRFTGYWSRRINREHRLVYKVARERIEFLQARYHY
jgi:toxin YoeB